MKEPANKLYIAYGSNMNIEQMSFRCPNAYVIGKSKIHDYELLFRRTNNNTGVATIEPKPGSIVPILIWCISPTDEVELDYYEGFPRLYTKENLQLKLAGKDITAMAYVMTDGHDLGTPGYYYESIIRNAYLSLEFDLNILDEAIAKSK